MTFPCKSLTQWLALVCLLASTAVTAQTRIYVSLSGKDTQSGSLQAPLASVTQALRKVSTAPSNEVEILLRKGTYYLPETIHISPKTLGDKKLVIKPYAQEKVTLSGGRKLALNWHQTNAGIWQARVSAEPFEQLFLNGKPQILARYPNYDSTARVFNGTAADALQAERIQRWKNPKGGYIHALHSHEWGDFHYRITGKTGSQLSYEGGWQNNRPDQMHSLYRMVENIEEELDAPGEWFYDVASHLLSYLPPPGVNPPHSRVEIATLKSLFSITGDPQNPVKNVTIQNLRLIHTQRTFMESYEPLLRSDWTLYRGAAVYLENAQNCTIQDCELAQLGGNAILVSRYNRNIHIKGCHIHHIGASAIGFVGDASAVRSPSFRYEEFIDYKDMDLKPGPKTDAYPAECLVEDNLIHHLGQIEKQSTGVEIAMAYRITVRSNSMYQMPRAGINIGDGTWGGHILEGNDVFDTVLETGDHGSFNSWGRDRFWHPNRQTMDSLVAMHPELTRLDALEPIVIRNNRFRCDHGWDIDLDDGSSNYLITNNVLLNGGLKFREGFYRIARNNILVNNTFHPHVWFKNSGDVFENNIVMQPYLPVRISDWGTQVNDNFFLREGDLKQVQQQGTDARSLAGPAEFVNPASGDFRVKKTSLALRVGFKNFAMDQFGVRKPALRQIAKTPVIPPIQGSQELDALAESSWLGAKVRNIKGLGDRSAFGLPDESGVLILEVPLAKPFLSSGLQAGDVIRKVNDTLIRSVKQLVEVQQQFHYQSEVPIQIIRNQQNKQLTLKIK